MFCPECGAETIDGDVFCPACGTTLSGGSAPAQPTQPTQPTQPYQPPAQMQPMAPAMAPVPVTPRRDPKKTALIAAAIAIAVIGLGAIGWSVYSSGRGSSADPGASGGQTNGSTETTDKPQDGVTEGSPEETVDAFYQAMAEGDSEGVFATLTSAGTTTFDRSMLTNWTIPGYQLLGSEERPDGTVVVSVQEYDGGLSNGVVLFTLVDENGWKIDSWLLGDTPGGASTGGDTGGEEWALDPEIAANVVGEMLFSLQNDDVARARELATARLQQEAPEFFYPAGGALSEFEAIDVYRDGGTFVVVMREDWISGPEEITYIVVDDNGQARVDTIIYPD